MTISDSAEALTFIESMRSTIANRVGFRWMVEKLSDLEAYVGRIAEENETLNAYLDSAGERADYEAYVESVRRARATDT